MMVMVLYKKLNVSLSVQADLFTNNAVNNRCHSARLRIPIPPYSNFITICNPPIIIIAYFRSSPLIVSGAIEVGQSQ